MINKIQKVYNSAEKNIVIWQRFWKFISINWLTVFAQFQCHYWAKIVKFLWLKFPNPVRFISFQLNQWTSSTVCIKIFSSSSVFLFSSSTLVLFFKYSFVCLLFHWVPYFLACLLFITLWVCHTSSIPFVIAFHCLYPFFCLSLLLHWFCCGWL